MAFTRIKWRGYEVQIFRGHQSVDLYTRDHDGTLNLVTFRFNNEEDRKHLLDVINTLQLAYTESCKHE